MDEYILLMYLTKLITKFDKTLQLYLVCLTIGLNVNCYQILLT